MTSSRERALRWKSAANKENNLEEEFIEETLQRLIDRREAIYAVYIQEFLELPLKAMAPVAVKFSAEKIATLDLLDRAIAYTLAKRDRDAEREMHERGNW